MFFYVYKIKLASKINISFFIWIYFTYTLCVYTFSLFLMDDIIKKLKASGISSDIIEKLKSGLGDKFESSIMSDGFKAAAAKVGIDTTDLPEIDFKNAMEAIKEFIGKDVDGDGKTGISEAIDNVKDAVKNTDMDQVKQFATKNVGGVFKKIKGFLGIK